MAFEPKWTPGPWRVEQGTTLVWGRCNPADPTTYGMGYPLTQCRITPSANWANGPTNDEGAANAHLISAAPEMYSAHAENKRLLELLLNDLVGRVDASKLAALETAIDRSEAVMRKAEGRSDD